MPTCPHCAGEGGGEAFVNRGPDIRTHSIEWVECATCRGSGKVSVEKMQAIEIGKKLRDARIERGQSLLDAAREMGLGPAELSAREHGRS